MHGDVFALCKASAVRRLERIKRKLHARSARICAYNNSRQSTDMDLPSALDAPDRYSWTAWEFGSHHFDFLRAMHRLSGGRCGVVGVDGDPNMPAHLSVTFEEFFLYHVGKFQKCKPDVCCFAGNCASFSQQSVNHHGRNEEPVNGAPDSHRCADRKRSALSLEFACGKQPL